MADPDAVNEAKGAFLRYCSSQQSSHGALIIGFSVALLTLLQTVQSSSESKLSSIFPLSFPIELLSAEHLAMLKLVLLSLSIYLLVTVLIYIIMRFWFYGYFSTAVLSVKPSDIMGEAIHDEISSVALKILKDSKKRIFRYFDATMFVSGAVSGKKTQHRKGVLWCFILALLPTLILLLLSW